MHSIDDYSYQVGYERALTAMLKLQIDQLCRLIDANRRLWDLGDGVGGEVNRQIQEAFDRYDFPRQVTVVASKRKRAPMSRTKIIQVMLKSEGRCVNCGSKNELQVDHIIPHSRGGSDKVENLQMLCKPCNLDKRDKTMAEWKGAS
jgi:5-methylcytosine-specific restriction endonuclease McrA